MLEQLVQRVFQTRDIAHREHWRTRSYAAHVALGFYEDIIETIDSIVETAQGEGKLIGTFEVTVPKMPPEILPYLKKEVAWIEENRADIADGCTAIENLIDSLIQHYRTAIYKLQFLS